MSKKFKAITAAALSFWILECISCSVLSFEELETSVSAGECQNYFDGERLLISFSIGVNQAQAETLFALKEEGAACEIDSIWNGKTCRVKARGGFKKGRKYSFCMKGSVLTSDGRTYTVDIFREFVYGTQADYFCAQTIEEPKKNGGQQNALTFTFNKAVDAAIFEREFNLSPSLEVKKNYSDDMSRVEIVPAEKWKANIFYTWRLGDVCAKDGAKICREYSGTFMAAEKNEAPKLLFVCPVLESGLFLEQTSLDDLYERQGVGFVFDCEMDFESVRKGIYWAPFLDGYWEKVGAARFVFIPYESYKIGEKYSLTISDSVEDTLGLKLAQSVNLAFTAQSQFIDAKVFLNGSPLVCGQVNAATAAQGCPIIFTLEFSKVLDKKSIAGFKNAVSLAPHFPLEISSPDLESVKALGGNAIQVEYGNFEFSEDGEEKIYVLKISGGENFIYDAYGEHFKEDACYYILLKK